MLLFPFDKICAKWLVLITSITIHSILKTNGGCTLTLISLKQIMTYWLFSTLLGAAIIIQIRVIYGILKIPPAHVIFVYFMSSLHVQCRKWIFNSVHTNSISSKQPCTDFSNRWPKKDVLTLSPWKAPYLGNSSFLGQVKQFETFAQENRLISPKLIYGGK